MNKKLDFKMSELDDYDLAKLDKSLKRQGKCTRKLGPSKVDSLDLSRLDAKEISELEGMVEYETRDRSVMPEKIDDAKISEDEWRDIFEMPDFLRHANPSVNSSPHNSNINYPFIPAEYFRHARMALRRKLAKSRQDRKEILDEFFASAVSDNLLMLQCMRLYLDKIYIDRPGTRFQDSFTVNFGTINSVKERKEKHLMALFESMSRIENIPVSIGQVGQLNLASNQQVNNEMQKPPSSATVIDAEVEDAH